MALNAGTRNMFVNESISHFNLAEAEKSIYMIDTYIRNRQIVSEEEKKKKFIIAAKGEMN